MLRPAFPFEALRFREVRNALVIAQFVEHTPSLLLAQHVFVHRMGVREEP